MDSSALKPGEAAAPGPRVATFFAESAFVRMRETRDRMLEMPNLILPAIQINMRAGHLPPPEDNGVRYLKLPVDAI